MLGIIRFFLASCVVAFHLTAKIPLLGNLAVNFFYVISGFLITLILNKTYNFNFAKFSINRIIRLYPTYYFFLVIGAIIIFTLPHAKEFHGSWSGKFISGDWLGNLFIFPWAFLSDNAVPNPFGALTNFTTFFTDGNRFRIVTSSWSVAVELVCYFLIWLFIARNLIATISTIILASAYHVYVFYSSGSVEMAYFPFLAAILPFSIGSVGFFISDKINNNSNLLRFSTSNQVIITLFSIVVFLVNWRLLVITQNGEWHPFFYYANNIISVFIVVILANSKPIGTWKVISKWLGDLSYPVFLCQYFGGYFAWCIVGFNQVNRGWDIFFIGYPISIIMSVICVILIDRRASKIRDIIRPEKFN